MSFQYPNFLSSWQVCELYERLLSCAKSELCEDNTSSGGQDVWRHLKSVFLTPVVQALQTENRAQKLHILEVRKFLLQSSANWLAPGLLS